MSQRDTSPATNESASEALERHMESNRRAATFAVVGLDFARKQAEEIDRLRSLLSEKAQIDADLKKHAERYGTASAERVKIVLPVTSKFDYDNQRERYYDANGHELWPDDLIEALNAAPSAPSSAADTPVPEARKPAPSGTLSAASATSTFRPTSRPRRG